MKLNIFCFVLFTSLAIVCSKMLKDKKDDNKKTESNIQEKKVVREEAKTKVENKVVKNGAEKNKTCNLTLEDNDSGSNKHNIQMYCNITSNDYKCNSTQKIPHDLESDIASITSENCFCDVTVTGYYANASTFIPMGVKREIYHAKSTDYPKWKNNHLPYYMYDLIFTCYDPRDTIDEISNANTVIINLDDEKAEKKKK